MALNYEQYQQQALNAMSGLLGQSNSAYPAYVPTQSQAPVQQGYFDYTSNAPMDKVANVNYTPGLMGGDYDKLQQALTTPGQISAQNAYNTGMTNLTNVMGGRGLYGSSIMGNQMNQGLGREYMNALATNAANAAATRYGMQQQDINNLNAWNLQNFEAQRNQNYDLWRSGAADASTQNAYNQNRTAWDYSIANQMRDWQNAQAAEQFNYQLAKQAYANQMDESQYNRALGMLGGGTTLSNAAQNYQLAQQQLSNQEASNWGTLAGGLLNSGLGLFSGGTDSAYAGIKDLFK